MAKSIITQISPIITPIVIGSVHSLTFDPGTPHFIAASPSNVEVGTICVYLPGSSTWQYFSSPFTIKITEKP